MKFRRVLCRSQQDDEPVSLDTLFRMARGRAPSGVPTAACEMTKWFDTNYHYIVPELSPGQDYRIARDDLFAQVSEAHALGNRVQPVIPGPRSAERRAGKGCVRPSKRQWS